MVSFFFFSPGFGTTPSNAEKPLLVLTLGVAQGTIWSGGLNLVSCHTKSAPYPFGPAPQPQMFLEIQKLWKHLPSVSNWSQGSL